MPRIKPIEGKRRMIGVKVSEELWRHFRSLAVLRGTTATEMLEEAMANHLKKAGKWSDVKGATTHSRDGFADVLEDEGFARDEKNQPSEDRNRKEQQMFKLNLEDGEKTEQATRATKGRTSEKLDIIYEPKGEAGEYAPLAVNLRVGCEHACLYCYGPQASHTKREDFRSNVRTVDRPLERLERDARIMHQNGDDREVLLSFMTDPYPPEELTTRLTRQALEILIRNGVRFTVLTKGGTRACRDFDLLANYGKCSFGTTLTFFRQTKAEQWEPHAAPAPDRIEAIKTAHAMGIKTWVSLEPVIDPLETLTLIRVCHTFVDHWKVGKLNYNKEESSKVDWLAFRRDVTTLLDSVGADYYLKNSLAVL